MIKILRSKLSLDKTPCVKIQMQEHMHYVQGKPIDAAIVTSPRITCAERGVRPHAVQKGKKKKNKIKVLVEQPENSNASTK